MSCENKRALAHAVNNMIAKSITEEVDIVSAIEAFETFITSFYGSDVCVVLMSKQAKENIESIAVYLDEETEITH